VVASGVTAGDAWSHVDGHAARRLSPSYTVLVVACWASRPAQGVVVIKPRNHNTARHCLIPVRSALLTAATLLVGFG